MSDIEQIKSAIEILQKIENSRDIKIFNPKGLKYCQQLVTKYDSQMKMMNAIDERINKRLDMFEEKIIAFLNTILKTQGKGNAEDVKEIEKHIETINGNGKPTWTKDMDTPEMTELLCSNGHRIVILRDPEGQMTASVDGGANKPLTDSDIPKLKAKVESMDKNHEQKKSSVKNEKIQTDEEIERNVSKKI